MDTPLKYQIKRIVENRYDLGKFTGTGKIHGGTVNTSFRITVSGREKKEPYFLREYNPATREKEIRFEHALLNHLRTSGFELASAPVTCKDGATFFQAPASAAMVLDDTFWALFDFLEGQDKYTWTDTNLTDREFASSAAILAQLHHHGADFIKPADADRIQPPIMKFLPVFKQNFTIFAASGNDCRCRRLFRKHVHFINSIVDTGLSSPEIFQGMLKIPIHGDYHPGNLKFENEKGVGLFDFDWSKIDYRLFDVALALVYFTAQWQGAEAGCLRLQPFRVFLDAYQDACSRLERIDPMTQSERQALVHMLAYANLYVLNWSVTDFMGSADADDDDYYTYIGHGIRLMEWIEDNREVLATAINKNIS